MTTISKTLLTVAVAGLAGGSIIDFHGVGSNPGLAAVLPLGAVAFGLFLIVFMLEAEMAKYDLEQLAKIKPARDNNSAPSPQRRLSPQPIVPQLKEKLS